MKRTMIRNPVVQVAMLAVLSMMICAGRGQQEGVTGSADETVANDWTRAAEVRMKAALSQQVEAEEVLWISRELCQREYLEETDRRNGLIQAADMNFKAGELHRMAALNYERSAENWKRVVREYRRVSERVREQQAQGQVKRMQNRMLDAFEKASNAYELAADVYGREAVANHVRAGLSNERGAECREWLAERRRSVDP